MPSNTFWKYLNYSMSILLIAAGTLFGMMLGGAQAEQSPPMTKTNAPAAPANVSKNENRIIFGGREVAVGKPHAPLTIVMYYSMTCPHCHEYQKEELPKIQKEYIDKGLVRFVYRDFPTDSSAIKAAKIAWCQGTNQYLAFSKKLLETQDRWVPIDLAQVKKAENEFHEIATKELGITEKNYQKCIANENLEASILRQSFEAQKLYEINAAPAFLVNDKYYDGIVTTEYIQNKLLEMGIHG